MASAMDSNNLDLALTSGFADEVSASFEAPQADLEAVNSIAHNAADSAESEAAATSTSNAFASHWPKGSVKTTEIAMGGVKVKVRTDSTPALLKQIR